MPWAALWRRSLAVWLLPLFLVLSIARLQGQPASQAGYAVALTASGSGIVFLLAPLAAVCAAWEGARLRAPRLREFPRTRPLVQFVGQLILPTLAVTWGALVLSVAAAVGARTPDATILFSAAFVILAWALLGFALGAVLPAAVALPTSLLAGYLWMALPGALEPVWLRHLTGFWFDCCLTDQALSGRAVTGTALVAVGLLAAAWTLLAVGALRPRLIRIGLPVGTAAVPAVIACLVVSSLGPTPTVPRTSAVVCSPASPVICVWPEHKELLASAQDVAREAGSRWRAAGLAVPDRFSEKASDAGQGVAGRNAAGLSVIAGSTITVGFGDQPGPNDLLTSFVVAILPPPVPRCADTGPFLGADAYGYLSAWLFLVAGMPDDQIEQRVDAAALIVAHRVEGKAPTERNHWIARNLQALAGCDLRADDGTAP